MNKQDAFNALEQCRQSLISKIPTDAPAKGRRYLGYLIQEQMEAARMHLSAIYENQLEIGPGLAPVQSCESNPKYQFWCEGIRRHIQLSELSLQGERAP